MQCYNEFAENASYQALVNSYLREVDPGVWHARHEWFKRYGNDFGSDAVGYIELQLGQLGKSLLLTVDYRSVAGRHSLGQPYIRHINQFGWQRSDKLSAMFLLVEALYTDCNGQVKHKAAYLELLYRLTQSVQTMQHYLVARQDDDTLSGNAFIHAEQAVLFGHWLHPTPKSRQGMHDWQQIHYSPEMAGHFPLHFFSACRSLTCSSSRPDYCVQTTLLNIASDNNAQRKAELSEHLRSRMHDLVAVHPLQAQWLLHQPHVRALLENGSLVEIGPTGAHFTPTSSVRTLYCDTLDVMIKVSIPVKVTNSLRVNKFHELPAGPALSELIDALKLSSRNDAFTIVDDPGFITLAINEEQVESGFELIVRQNPFYSPSSLPDDVSEQTLAALVQAPLPGETQSRLVKLVAQRAALAECSVTQASLEWFDAYWRCAIVSLIKLYDEHGIGLEAHQQNSVLRTRHGLPVTYFYRDNQGYYLAESNQVHLTTLAPALQECSSLFYPDTMILQRFTYYLVINQLFGVINRFGCDSLLDEHQLLQMCQKRLRKLQWSLGPRGKQLVQHILLSEHLPCKGNLLTRVKDVDELEAELELAVYTQWPNPLHAGRLEITSDANLLSTSEVMRELA